MTAAPLQLLAGKPADDMISLRAIAAELQMKRTVRRKGGKVVEILDVAKLLHMARVGKFPRCMVIDGKHALVRREDYEYWKLGHWTSTPASRKFFREAALNGEIRNPRADHSGQLGGVREVESVPLHYDEEWED